MKKGRFQVKPIEVKLLLDNAFWINQLFLGISTTLACSTKQALSKLLMWEFTYF